MSAFANRIEADIRREAKRRRALFTVHYTPEVAEAIDELTESMQHAVWHALTSIEKVPYPGPDWPSVTITGTVPTWRENTPEEILADLNTIANQLCAEPDLCRDWVVREDERGTTIYHKDSISYTDGL